MQLGNGLAESSELTYVVFTSEGTLGIATAITLRLLGPECVNVVGGFRHDGSGRVVRSVTASGLRRGWKSWSTSPSTPSMISSAMTSTP